MKAYNFDIYQDGLLCPEDDIYFLRYFKEYNNNSKNENKYLFTYQDKCINELVTLHHKYRLDEIAGNGTDIEKQRNLTHWVSENLNYDSEAKIPVNFNSDYIIEHSVNKEFKSNCWMFSVVLNEIFLSFGFQTRMIRCLPMDLRSTECHCVTTVYSKEYEKWIIWDASINVEYLDEYNTPLSLQELRSYIIDKQKILIPNKPRLYKKRILNYWCKNLIRFECYLYSCYGAEILNEKNIVVLNPKNFYLTNKAFLKDKTKINIYNINSSDIFWQKPKKEGI